MSDMYKSNTVFETAITEEQKRPKKICSVFPEKLTITHPTGNYEIKGCKPVGATQELPYTFIEVSASLDKRDLGNATYLSLLSISAYDTALDIIGLARDRVNSRGQRVNPVTTSPYWERGLFVPAGDFPTEEELNAARARLRAWFEKALQDGDSTWIATKNPRLIDQASRLAARYLGEYREWAQGLSGSKAKEKIDCPACKEPVNAGAEICIHCSQEIGYKGGKPYWVRQGSRKAEQANAGAI